MVPLQGGKAPLETRVYGYSDVIRKKLRSLTEDVAQKDTLVLVVCLFLLSIPFRKLTPNAGITRNI